MSSQCVTAIGSVWTCQAIGLLEFLIIIALVFALFMVLAGIFTAYFGSGKSRTIGVVLLVVGIVVGLFAGWEYHVMSGHLLAIVEEGALILIAAVIGALVAVGLFLVAIMKS